MKEFRGGYWFTILEILEQEKRPLHGKECFDILEKKYGQASYINFLLAIKKMKKSNKIIASRINEEQKKECAQRGEFGVQRRVYFSLPKYSK